MRLLAAGDERLAKETADCFPSEEAKIPRTRGETKNLFGIRCTQPLEIDWQLRMVEIFTGWRGRKRMRRQCGRRGFDGRNSLSIECPQPAIFAPGHFLNGGFAAER